MAGIDTGRLEAAVIELLRGIGEDPARTGLAETPARVAAAWAEYFSGVGVDAAALLLDDSRTDPGAEETPQREQHGSGHNGGIDDRVSTPHGDLVIVRDIDFRSMCEHHLLPFTGVAHVAYSPRETLVGLGRIARMIGAVAARPQLQERLGDEIAGTLFDGAAANGVLVVLEATHLCVTTRGTTGPRSSTVTLASRGSLSSPAARAEAIALLARPSGERAPVVGDPE